MYKYNMLYTFKINQDVLTPEPYYKECALAHSRACGGRLRHLPYTPQCASSQSVLLYRKAISCKVKKLLTKYARSCFLHFNILHGNPVPSHPVEVLFCPCCGFRCNGPGRVFELSYQFLPAVPAILPVPSRHIHCAPSQSHQNAPPNATCDSGIPHPGHIR